MADLYGEFHDDDDLEENEDDIGALGSILSWDEEDEEDGQAVNRTAAAMSAALRERESAPGTSAPPDMVQFSVKDGVPQFNFLSNNGLLNSGNVTPQPPPQQNNEGNSSITLQLPMPTPISKFEGFPQQQQQSQAQQPAQNEAKSEHAEKQNLQTNSNSSASSSNPMQLVSQQQSQQGLAATFAQLLAQQAGTLFQQPSQSPQQQQTSQAPQQAPQTNPPAQQQVVQPGPAKAQNTQQQTPQQAQQAAIQQAQQQLQQLQQAQQAALQQHQQQAQQQQASTQQQPQQQQVQQQPQQQQVQQAQQQPAVTAASAMPSQQPQTQVPQMQIPFSTDPNTFLQQLQFAQFQHQLQMQAQQQQQPQVQPQQQPAAQQMQSFPQAPPSSNTASLQFNQSQATPLNPRPKRDGQPPTKRAKKSKTGTTKNSTVTKKAPPSSSAAVPALAAPSPAVASTKTGIVSASDTDCDGPNSKKRSSSSSVNDATSLLDDDSKLDSANLSSDDKAQANRDRNREHARNTRLRKKAYLEKLKTTVEELCRERDTLVSERTGAASLLVEMHNTRTEVLMSFFALRSSNEKRRKLWSSILDESSFTCATPVTPYRSFPASEVQVSKCQRTIMGIDGIMADTSSLHVLFESLVDKKKFPDARIDFRYTLVTEESVVAGNQMMARWVMSTVNATKCGALTEVTKQGMLCCKFNSAHRIIGLELMFDVMAFMLQLKQAAGSDSFSVIPNTVQTCQRTFDKPMVMTLAEPPYTIVQVNKLWEEMTGFTAEEVVGKKSCSILQGPKTSKQVLSQMMEDVRFKRPGCVHIMNVKKSGEEFKHFLLAFPLSTDSRVTHYVALSNHIQTGEEVAQQVAQQQQVQIAQVPATPADSGTIQTLALLNQGHPQAQNNTPQNVAPSQMPQFFVPPTPMVFQPQPQPVGSSTFQVAPSGLMAPPPNMPAQTTVQPNQRT